MLENRKNCGCEDKTKLCSCSTKLDLLCTFYNGEPLEPLNIEPGMNGETIIKTFNDYIRDILSNLSIPATVIESVGDGSVIYKGLSDEFIHEIKSLKNDTGIHITEGTDSIILSINQDWINDLITTHFNENVSFSMDYIYNTSLTPGHPNSDQTWTPVYTTNVEWMAFREVINGVNKPWKMVKIKGAPGKDGEDGEDGQDGQDGVGTNGQSSFTSNVFTRSLEQPGTPTGGSFDSPLPTQSNWFDGIPPANGNPAWMSSRIFTSDGQSPQQSQWSTPVLIVDTETVDFEFSNFQGTNPGNPTYPLNGATWHNEGMADDVWMAQRIVKNGVGGNWSVVRIKGEDGEDGDAGEDGQGTFTSIVFKRSPDNSAITTPPTGGSYNNPVPSGWSDGIPSGSGAVYQSIRKFTTDGLAPQDPQWSIPVLAIDNQYKDYEYSNHVVKPQDPSIEPSAWHNTPADGDIWQAVRDIVNGIPGAWSILRIKGEAGVSGLGFSVSSSNPVASIAVGSDNITNGTKTFQVGINAYRNATELAPTFATTLNDNQYRVELPTGLPTGLTVSQNTAGTLTFTLASGTTILDTIVVDIDVVIGSTNTVMKSTFTLVPIVTAEDAQALILNSDSNVISFDGYQNLVGPTNITFSVNLQNHQSDISWSSVPAGIVTGTGAANVKTVSSSLFFPSGSSHNSVKVRAEADNGLFDEVTIIKVRDGLPGDDGPPGLNGTAGPSIRTFEWVYPATYENTSEFLDYIYFRDLAGGENSTARGWYNVIKVDDADTTADSNIGVPDPAKFVKLPFTNLATFGTVIAEQANLAGFIFRNQILTSQQRTSQNCDGVLSPEYPNLTIDGFQGIIKFLERMILSKEGIDIKDDCGRSRMIFKFEDGIPILQFLDENGNIVWKAGQQGYVSYIVSRPHSYTELKGRATTIPLSSTPSISDVSNLTSPADRIFEKMICNCDASGIYGFESFENSETSSVVGYVFTEGTPDVTPTAPAGANGKIFLTENFNGSYISDGWYVTEIVTYNGVTTNPANMNAHVHFSKIVGGVITQKKIVTVDDVSMYFLRSCGDPTHETPECN